MEKKRIKHPKILNKKAAKRPKVLTAASIMFFVGGIVSLIAVLILMFTSNTIINVLNEPDAPKNALFIASTFLLLLIVISLIVGILDIVAGYGLWKMKKYGGIVALISAIVSLIISLLFISADYGFSFVYNLVEIILLILGWNYLS